MTTNVAQDLKVNISRGPTAIDIDIGNVNENGGLTRRKGTTVIFELAWRFKWHSQDEPLLKFFVCCAQRAFYLCLLAGQCAVAVAMREKGPARDMINRNVRFVLF